MSLHIDDDRIEKQIELKAPRVRVWRALTDYREFSQWFQVTLTSPFIPGQTTCGQITYPGYEHLQMEVVVQKLEPEDLRGSRDGKALQSTKKQAYTREPSTSGIAKAGAARCSL